MLCVLEIACLVFGIVILAKGRVSLTARKEVRGGPAYVIGLLLIAVLPVAVTLGIVVGLNAAQNAGGGGGFRLNPAFALIDLGVVVVLGLIALVVALVTAQPKRKKKKRRSAEEEDYDDLDREADDRPRRRRPAADLDDEDEDRPRRRRPASDDEDRPRRKRDDLDDRAR
jgi:hypothetical protein